WERGRPRPHSRAKHAQNRREKSTLDYSSRSALNAGEGARAPSVRSRNPLVKLIDRGHACDSAILAVKQGSRTAQIASLLPCPRPLRPRRPRVQTSALLGRFNLDVAEKNRAAGFHDLGGANGAEDAINKTYAVHNSA